MLGMLITFRYVIDLCLSHASSHLLTDPYLQIIKDDSQVDADKYDKRKVVFHSPTISMDLRAVVSGENICSQATADEDDEQEVNAGVDGGNEVQGEGGPQVTITRLLLVHLLISSILTLLQIFFKELDLSKQGHKGTAIYSEFELKEGEVVDFIFRDIPKEGFDHVGEKREASQEHANDLGVDLVALTKAVSKIRTPLDPVLNAHLVEALIKVCISLCSFLIRT